MDIELLTLGHFTVDHCALMTQIAVTCLFTADMWLWRNVTNFFFKKHGAKPKCSRKHRDCNTYFAPPGSGARVARVK
jgi:hypothetical protein